MKYDRARWQIILSPSFRTPDDPFVKYQLDNKKWAWYRLKALIIQGQQFGRVVRANDDFGTTYLIDERFKKFLHDVEHLLPEWQKISFVA